MYLARPSDLAVLYSSSRSTSLRASLRARSDRSAALCLLEVSTGVILTESVLDLAPEALEAWWRKLRAAHPTARIAVAFEQPAPNLLAFFAPVADFMRNRPEG